MDALSSGRWHNWPVAVGECPSAGMARNEDVLDRRCGVAVGVSDGGAREITVGPPDDEAGRPPCCTSSLGNEVLCMSISASEARKTLFPLIQRVTE